MQSTSPLFARQSYWCIVETLKARRAQHCGRITCTCRRSASGASCSPGDRSRRGSRRRGYRTNLRFLTVRNLPSLFDFPRDMERVEAEVNRLNEQVLVRYYEREWSIVAR